MADSIFNIAVISFPRTASKSLAEWYGRKYNKSVALGSLHTPEYLGRNLYDTKRIVKDKTDILHGHWHSLHKLDPETLGDLLLNYKIVTCYRKEELVRASILRVTGKDLFDKTMHQTLREKGRWKIWKEHIVNGDQVETVEGIPHGYC